MVSEVVNVTNIKVNFIKWDYFNRSVKAKYHNSISSDIYKYVFHQSLEEEIHIKLIIFLYIAYSL